MLEDRFVYRLIKAERRPGAPPRGPGVHVEGPFRFGSAAAFDDASPDVKCNVSEI